ncbi:uncharacterized protein TRAVEDRAFT_51979 [Trametes versicolor FP-101664 SS1]|uniref:uncharacterized protein n=1 Tax=Trametes versicolor (strain FP-101664) TaxID=717944 RepID=UPI0004622BC7|nr:uncharacterized protein TRAVEDRAFT_51979 [Trametes versicolor FP-101664 SS1]EIW54266.1 hypothetical protein TRAVEDRAFT_51979 [Trametes versicolor FP-101664 SS1]
MTFKAISRKRWALLAMKCLDEVEATFRRVLAHMVQDHFCGVDRLGHAVGVVLIDLLGVHVAIAKQQVEVLLKYESNPPSTQNTAELAKLRGEYLALYNHQSGRTKAGKGSPDAYESNGTAQGNPDGQPFDTCDDLTCPAVPSVPMAAHVVEHEYAEEVKLMADVRAYLDISRKRFMDYIPCAIDEHLLFQYSYAVHGVLVENLGLVGEGTSARCASYLGEGDGLQAS